MKKNIFLSFLFLTSLFFTSCNKDDDNIKSDYTPSSIQGRTISLSNPENENSPFIDITQKSGLTIITPYDKSWNITNASSTYKKNGKDIAQLTLNYTITIASLTVEHYLVLELHFTSDSNGTYSGSDRYSSNGINKTTDINGYFTLNNQANTIIDFSFLPGKWKNTSDKTITYLVFNKDKTYSIHIEGKENVEATGIYSYNPEKYLISITLKGETEASQYKVLSLTENELKFSAYISSTQEYAPPVTYIRSKDDENVVISEPIIENVTCSSALIKGTILGNNIVFSERGICYSTSPVPTLADNKKTTQSDVVNITLSGLTENTKYYARLYAKVKENIIYGNTISFQTEKDKVSSTPPIKLKASVFGLLSVTLKAELSNSINKYGICYGKSPNPKITDSITKEADRATEWEISLSQNSSYYIRAYHIEGTNIIYYEDSEIMIETIGKTIKIKGDLEYKKASYNARPLVSALESATFKVSYENLPKGTYKTTLTAGNINGNYATSEQYINKETGTITLYNSYFYDNSSLFLDFHNIENDISYKICYRLLMDEDKKEFSFYPWY